MLHSVGLWTKRAEGESEHIRLRAESVCRLVGKPMPDLAGQTHGPPTFSEPVPHGEMGGRLGAVMMTRVEGGKDVFVHASDIQLLGDRAVGQILRWHSETSDLHYGRLNTRPHTHGSKGIRVRGCLEATVPTSSADYTKAGSPRLLGVPSRA